MANLPADGNITADGDYDITLPEGIRFDVNIAGSSFGGGTVVMSQQNPASSALFSPFTVTSAITSNFTDVLQARGGSVIRFSLSGATAPNIFIHIAAVRNG